MASLDPRQSEVEANPAFANIRRTPVLKSRVVVLKFISIFQKSAGKSRVRSETRDKPMI